MAKKKKTTPVVKEASSEKVEPRKKIKEDIRFPIVGIGASAGGLVAFNAFFSGFPKDTAPGLAFILVQHLAPDHSSILAELIRKFTPMQVFEVEDGMKVQVNCVYIIPPGYDMAFLNDCLQLFEPSAPRGQRLPIDFFFRSLGIRAIKGEGGMVIVQTPDTTEFDGMPRSAIGTELVDYELPPAEMPAQLITYVSYAFGRCPLPGPAQVKQRHWQ